MSEAVTLRHCGPSHYAHPEIARRAEADLGFEVEIIEESDAGLIERAINRPETLDIYDLDHWSYRLVLPHGVLRGIPLSEYRWWDDTLPIFVSGTLPDGTAMSSQGTLPSSVQYLEDPERTEFADAPTETIAMVPHSINADTLGVRPDLIGRPIRSWSELLNPELAGRVALNDIPEVGIMDAAMAFEAAGEITYADKGDMSREEIDRTVERLIELERSGHFHSFWTGYEESVELLASGEVVLQPMWSPAVAEVRVRGVRCDYPALDEGYRGWSAGLGIMRHVEGRELKAAYEYLNWYGSGWAGAFIARQGYYHSVPETARRFLSDDEWGYWYEGAPAIGPITDPHGELAARPGTARFGGSMWDRLGRIACWNTAMRENDYLLERWSELVPNE